MSEYRVIAGGAQIQEFKKLCDEALAAGRLPEVTAAAKAMTARLQNDPQTAGELLYRLKHSGWPVCHVVHKPLSMHIAIDEQHQIVYITKTVLLGT
jgi:hypothetical protein